MGVRGRGGVWGTGEEVTQGESPQTEGRQAPPGFLPVRLLPLFQNPLRAGNCPASRSSKPTRRQPPVTSRVAGQTAAPLLRAGRDAAPRGLAPRVLQAVPREMGTDIQREDRDPPRKGNQGEGEEEHHRRERETKMEWNQRGPSQVPPPAPRARPGLALPASRPSSYPL